MRPLVGSVEFSIFGVLSPDCFDVVGWVAGRASGLYKTEWWGAGVVICLERCADLHMAQLMPLPLTVSCFSKIRIGFTFLVPAHPGSPGQRAVKRVCVSPACSVSADTWGGRATEHAKLIKCNGIQASVVKSHRYCVRQQSHDTTTGGYCYCMLPVLDASGGEIYWNRFVRPCRIESINIAVSKL